MRFIAAAAFLTGCAVPGATAFVPQSTSRASVERFMAKEDPWARLTESVTSASTASPSAPLATKVVSKPAIVDKIVAPSTPVEPASTVSGSESFLPDIIARIDALKSNADQALHSILSPNAQLPNLMDTDLSALIVAYQMLPVWEKVGLAAVPAFLATFVTLYTLSFPADNYRAGIEPYARGKYDPIQAKAFYSRNKMVVLQRTLQLVRLSNKFIISLLWDKYVTKKEEENRAVRAEELLELITKLGPTAIKIGQVLSVRPDILPAEYANSLASLQDQVPPFSSEAARELLLQELGPAQFDRIQGIRTAEPVASASIGQVYKATINDPVTGPKTVAVKVQRPNVLAEIALDLHIVRDLAPLYQKYIAKSSTDLQSLANEWGRGFIKELDYREEARNTIKFNKDMQERKLTAVTAPTVVNDFSTEQILVTEWVDGVRIDRCPDKEDIPRLCSIALNAYLTMLLETKALHCDPHPGNLLRTTDGKLCILDFGMTLEVNEDLQYALLEYIAHITSNNYDEVPEDLVKMGFLKPDKLEYAKRSGFLEPLVYFLKQAGEGGGAKGVRDRIIADFRSRYPGLDDKELQKAAREEMQAQMQEMARKESAVTGITTEVEELQRRNQDSFQVPEWFVYGSRAFGTLEGVSLQADENYSLVQSCFPYIAKRLVEDQSPRSQKALKDLIYGAGDMIDVERLSDLAGGFSTYTTTTKTTNTEGAPVATIENGETKIKTHNEKSKLAQAEASVTLAKDSADVLLNPKGNLVQTILIEESALAASAGFKDQVRDTFVDAPRKFRESLPFGVGSFLPPLPTEAVAPFVRKTADEEKAQRLVSKISSLVPQPSLTDENGQSKSNPIDTQALNSALNDLEPEQAALIVKELRENLPTYTPLVRRLGDRFISALLRKASDNIETTLSEMDESNQLLRTTAKGISSVAMRGASRLEESTSDKSEKETEALAAR